MLEKIAFPTVPAVAEAPITAMDLGSKMHFNDFMLIQSEEGVKTFTRFNCNYLIKPKKYSEI
jgi:hypothetical protein